VKSVLRGIRNSYRSKGRAVLVIVLLGLSVGIVITMLQVSRSVSANTDLLKRNVETLIEVRAAGATAMGRGVEALREDVAEPIGQLSGVRSFEKYLYVRQVDNTKRFPVSVIAGMEPITSELRVNSHGEVGSPRVTKGRGFGPADAGKTTALVGEVYAEQNDLDSDLFNHNFTSCSCCGFPDGFPRHVHVSGEHSSTVWSALVSF